MICLDDGSGAILDDGIDALYYAISTSVAGDKQAREKQAEMSAQHQKFAGNLVHRPGGNRPKAVLAVPGEHQSASSRSKYLEPLLLQDWSHLFQGGDTERRYCVYAHIDPRKERFATSLFAGGDYRAFRFTSERAPLIEHLTFAETKGHGKVLREIIAAGFCEQDIVKVIMQDMTEAKALEMESKLIYFSEPSTRRPGSAARSQILTYQSDLEFSAVMGSMPSIQRASLHRQSTKGD